MATEQEYRSILIPNQPFRRLKIADYISQGKKKKLFKGEYIRTSAKTIDDLYYYYIDEGQIVATFEQESGEVAPLYWRNAGNAFSAEYNDYASIGRYKARFIAAQNTVLFAFTQRQLYELSQDDPGACSTSSSTCATCRSRRWDTASATRATNRRRSA